jgi:hypothetical protein
MTSLFQVARHGKERRFPSFLDSNQDVHLDSLSLHSPGRQKCVVVVGERERERRGALLRGWFLRPFIGRPNCDRDSKGGTLNRISHKAKRKRRCVSSSARGACWAGDGGLPSRQVHII